MRILILNSILYTPQRNMVPKVESIKDTMIYALCMGFLDAGHTPILIAAEEYRPIKKEEYPFRIIFLKCKYKHIFSPSYIPYMPSLWQYLHKEKCDLIITSEVFSLCTLMAVCAARKKTVIWHELAMHNHIFKKIPSKLWYNIVARLIYRNALIVPRSPAAYNFISKYCNHVSKEYIDHGVNLSQFECNRTKKRQFVVVSQLIQRKKIDDIIINFCDFLKRFQPDFKLYIIGEVNLKANLERQAKELGIENAVIFMGYRKHEEMAFTLSESQALLVNTIKDNSMVSIVESIASGTPVLTNTTPNNSAYIRKNELGIVKDNWDSEDMNLISQNNKIYTENCINYRRKLSNTYCACKFVDLYNLKNN